MVNTQLLEEKIRTAGKKKVHLAKCCGITYAALYNKTHNRNQFTAAQILTLSEELNLSAKERDRIFFAPEVN